MPEPLPRYRKAGVLLADIPRLDFTGARENAKSTAMLSERLDQLSNWAFGEAAARAKDEGLQYGAENPVTVQQLKDGTARFAPRGTVFGAAARAAQIASITSDIELESQQKLNALKLGVEHGEIDILDARNEIQALLDGTGKSLAQIDPKASLKVRASLGTAANSAFVAMTQAHLKRQQENKRVAVDGWIDGAVADQVRMHIEVGDTVDPDTKGVVTPEQRIGTLRSTLNEQLNALGDDVFARQARVRFEKLVSDARIDALVKIANDPAFAKDRNGKFDPIGAVARLDKGDFGAYTEMFRAMPSEEQAKVRTALRQAAADRFTADQHVEQERKRNDTLEVNRLVVEYDSANPARSREILRRLTAISTSTGAISGTAINALVKARKGEGEGAGAQDGREAGEFRLRAEVLNGTIRTPEHLWQRGRELGVKPKQANEVLGLFINRQNRSETDASRKLMRAAGLTSSMINPAQHRAEALIAMEREADEQFRKRLEAHQADPKKNPPPDREAIADEIVRRRQEAPASKAIENTLQALNDAYGPNGTTKKTGIVFTEDTSIDDARKALKAANVPDAMINQAVDRLRSIEVQRRKLNALRP